MINLRAQIGNDIGVAARDRADETLLASVVTDIANGFTVTAADIRNLYPGMVIDLLTRSTGAVGAGAAGRTIVSVDVVTNTVIYSGADLTLTNLFGAYLAGTWEPATPVAVNGVVRDDYANLNGGPSVYQGFDMAIFGSVQLMRERLTAISATTYSSAELDKMTMNDLIYALRINDAPGSI